jgi:hypothetical protein
MPDPPKAGGIYPVNRIGAFFGPVPAGGGLGEQIQARYSALLRLRTQLTGGDPADVVPEIARASTPEMDSLAVRWEWESCYRVWYELAKSAVDSGKDRSEIRARFLHVAEDSGAMAHAVREALDDALAGRPPKYKFPHSP